MQRLTQEEAAAAGVVLGSAFLDDPLWTGVLASNDRRLSQLIEMFTALTRATVGAGGVAEATQGTRAVALWLPPGKDLGFVSMLRSGFALPRFAMKLPGPDRKRMMAVLRQIGDEKRTLMPEPHWYLSAVGVVPGQQGEGLGSSLVRAGLARAHHDGVPVYLETETDSNVTFYEHLGFRVIGEVTATGLGFPVWMLVWRPGDSG